MFPSLQDLLRLLSEFICWKQLCCIHFYEELAILCRDTALDYHSHHLHTDIEHDMMNIACEYNELNSNIPPHLRILTCPLPKARPSPWMEARSVYSNHRFMTDIRTCSGLSSPRPGHTSGLSSLPSLPAARGRPVLRPDICGERVPTMQRHWLPIIWAGDLLCSSFSEVASRSILHRQSASFRTPVFLVLVQTALLYDKSWKLGASAIAANYPLLRIEQGINDPQHQWHHLIPTTALLGEYKVG